jgi:uncharacterized protein (DUF1697 family)
MPRYVAFLRGVSPLNAKSADLKRSFETAGFTNVKTILSSGNIAFDASSKSESVIERRAEVALQESIGRSFYTIVRSSALLKELLAQDPYTNYTFPPHAKRVVSFLRASCESKVSLPVLSDDAYVLGMIGREVFTAYTPNPKGPVFMQLIERAFGANVTTRTWESVRKCSIA